METDIPDKADSILDLSSPHIISMLRELIDRDISVRIRVTGSSMQPFLLGGETVTLRHVQKETLRIGDLIFFVDNDNRPIMHRIVRLRFRDETIQLQTKGDGLRGLDAPLDATQVLGRVEHVTYPQTDNRSGHPTSLYLDRSLQRVQSVFLARRSLYCFYCNRFRQLLKVTLRLVKRSSVFFVFK